MRALKSVIRRKRGLETVFYPKLRLNRQPNPSSENTHPTSLNQQIHLSQFNFTSFCQQLCHETLNRQQFAQPLLHMVLGIRCQASGVRCQAPGNRCWASGARCQVLGLRCQVSGARCQVLGVREECVLTLSACEEDNGDTMIRLQQLRLIVAVRAQCYC